MTTLNNKWLLPLGLLSTLLLSSDDLLQQWLTNTSNHAKIEWNFIATMWLFSVCLWVVSSRLISNIILGVFCVFSAVQLGNIAYFGQPLNPADLPNLFNDLGEVWQTGSASFADHWVVPLCTLLPFGTLFYLHNRYRFSASLAWQGICLVLVVAILASKPYRATYRSMAFFMPGPTRSSLHNSINAWAYFGAHLNDIDAVLDAGRIAPDIFSYEPPSAAHVWLVVADSLRTDRLSAFGYERNTTPNLRRRVENGSMLAKPGIAAGVSTIVSLSHMLNQVHHPGRQNLLRNNHSSIFRHAKAQGYQTLWLSSQESKLLSFLGADHIDIKLTNEDFPLLFAQRGDAAISDVVDQQNWQKNSFAVINLRTVHSPYASNYEGIGDHIAHWPTDDTLERHLRENNAYDNALVFLDEVIETIIARFEALPGEGYLVITGDHGQFLGRDNRWGHNKLEPEITEVPVLILGKNSTPTALDDIRSERWVSHLEMMHWIGSKMGIVVQNAQTEPNLHFVKGSKLLGDNHIMTVRESDSGLIYGPQQLVSEWLSEENSEQH